MDFEIKLKEFADKHNLCFLKQEFENCFDRGFLVRTFSIYNNTGCFTIHYLVQRMELDFYISDKIYSKREDLCQKDINIYEYEKTIWNRNRKVGLFNNPFFYDSPSKVISTLIEVMETLATKNKKVFNISIY